MPVHPTAIVDPAAEIDESVEIGPYAIIDVPAKIASGCRISSHAILLRDGFDLEARTSIKRAFELVFRRGFNLKPALEEAEKQDWDASAAKLFEFFREKTSREFCLQALGAGESRS